MEKYILLTILIAFVIYLFCKKKDLIEGVNLSRLLGRGARVSEKGATKAERLQTYVSTRFSRGLERASEPAKFQRELQRTDAKAFSEITGDLNRTLGTNNALDANIYNNLDEEGRKMISRASESRKNLKIAGGGAEEETKMGAYIEELKKETPDPETLNRLKGEAQEETVYFERMQEIKGDLPVNYSVPSKLEEATATDMATIYEAEAKNLGILPKIRIQLTEFIRRNPRITAIIGSGFLLYEVIQVYKNPQECQEICLAGPPGTEEKPFSVWLETHDPDEYDENCGGDSTAECETYCLASGSGACSEANEATRAGNQFINDAKDILIGGGSDDPDDDSILGWLMDIFKIFLPDDWTTTLYVVGTCCCLIVSLFVTFVVYRRISSKAVSTLANIKSSNTAFSNDLRAFNQSTSIGQRGGGKIMNNKMVIMVIFFIFIIYNEWGRK